MMRYRVYDKDGNATGASYNTGLDDKHGEGFAQRCANLTAKRERGVVKFHGEDDEEGKLDGDYRADGG